MTVSTFPLPKAVKVVLVVEDDPVINMNLVAAVEAAGCVALDVFNATSALKVLAARPEISVMMTDVQMRGEMDGRALAFEVRRQYPSLPIIIVTGFARGELDDLPEGVGYLAKPFAGHEIEAAVLAAVSGQVASS